MKTINNEWIKQDNWKGNPNLGYISYMKHFKRGTLNIPVYIFGLPDSKELNFCVSAGANSDYSYTGCFFPEKLSLEETMQRIDEKYQQGKLIF